MIKHLYIAFAAPDVYGRDAVAGHILNEKLSIKCQFPDKDSTNWRQEAAALIDSADRALVLLSRDAEQDEGLAWELQQLSTCSMPVLGVQVHADSQHRMRNAACLECIDWDWPLIRNFLLTT